MRTQKYLEHGTRSYGERSHTRVPGIVNGIEQLRTKQFYISAANVLVISDYSVSEVEKALDEDGKVIYRIPAGGAKLIPTSGKNISTKRLCQFKKKIDMVISGCRSFSSEGSVYTRWARTKDFLSRLAALGPGVMHDGAVRIVLANDWQLDDGSCKSSKWFFNADWVLGPGGLRPTPYWEKRNLIMNTSDTGLPSVCAPSWETGKNISVSGNILSSLLRNCPADQLQNAELCQSAQDSGKDMQSISNTGERHV